MELGYKASQKIIVPGEHGAWKYCREDDLRRIVGDNPTSLKLTVMADAERTDYHEDILPKNESVMDMVRVATYISQIPTALEMVKDAHDKGYETTINLMAVSTVPDYELNEGLELLAKSEAQAIYVVDSFGTLYSEQVQLPGAQVSRLLQGGRQGSRHARSQQPAIGLRQHHRGDCPGREHAGRHDGRPGPRRRQLPDGAAHRLPAQPQVQPAPRAALRAGRRSNQCARNCCGVLTCPTCSPAS